MQGNYPAPQSGKDQGPRTFDPWWRPNLFKAFQPLSAMGGVYTDQYLNQLVCDVYKS